MERIDQLLEEASVPIKRRARARAAILSQQIGAARITGGWLLRISPGASIWKQARHARIHRPLSTLVLLHFIQQALSIAGWFVIGRGVFQGHFDQGWLAAWVILLLSGVPLQVLLNDAQSELSMGSGAIIKQRLLYGTLRLDPEEIRHQGMGQFLGRVMESEAVEMLALSGGFSAVLSVVELGMAAAILAQGEGGALHAALLGVWALITLFILWRYFLNTRAWTTAYRSMTNDLVERMVGHRTRLAQEDRRHWHDEEDQALDQYLRLSENLDRMGIQLNAFITRGWLIVGLAGLVYPFIADPTQTVRLAVGLGGILLASQALNTLVGGVQSLTGLAIAWEQVGPLFHAAARPRDSQALDFIFKPGRDSKNSSGDKSSPEEYGRQSDQNAPAIRYGQEVVLAARDVVFRYRPQGQPVLRDCSLQIYHGDRVLLEGPSGGGKTTLAAVLTGLRRPEAGSLLLWGYDREILGGEEWRRRVIMAPQFQENHVFADTLAFNLLMGSRWPPQGEDLQEAEMICQELGLGELLERMPSGMQQMVGENGWQLSHGERSRLYIARTLLQRADLIILDESFGALDPENLHRALQTVLERAPTLLVIAHP